MYRMELKVMKKRIAQAPKRPGVYMWRTRSGIRLYIGKAADIRSRLLSYPKTTDERIQAMIEKAKIIDWIETETSIEALILESQLIKRYKPKYNIALRDDKSYVMVAITDEAFPQFLTTHQVRSRFIKKPVKEFLGPFTDARALKTTLKVLRRLFPYCTCKQRHHVKCLNAHIGMCAGYCCLKVDATAAQKKEYARYVRAIRDILTGKRDTLIKRLRSDMRAAADAHNLEEARDLQIQVERISRVFENAQIITRRLRTATKHHGALDQMQTEFGLHQVPSRIEGYDVAHIQGTHPSGTMVVFTEGSADSAEYRLFNIRTKDGGDTGGLREIVSRRLTHEEWPLPDVIIVDGAKAQLNAVVRVLDKAGLEIPVIAFAKDEKHKGSYVLFSGDSQVRTLKKLPIKVRNLIDHVDQEAHRFVIKHYRQRHRKALTPSQRQPLKS